jgi:cobalt/nickel transport system permease protein
MRHLDRHRPADDHPLTRLDARVKLIAVLTLLVMVISSRGPVFPLFMAGIAVTVSLSIGVRPRLLAGRFAQPLFIALMVFGLKLFFSGTEPLFSRHLFGLEIVGHRDGLHAGLLIASRIAGAVSLVALLGFATSFTDLMAALAWLRIPRSLIDVALFAWRYLFLLFDDALVVYHAQKNRLGYAGWRRGVRSFGTLAGALVIKAFDNSQTVTTAMVQRGYDGTMPLLRHRPFRPGEVMVSLAVVIIMGLVWQNL